MSVTVCIAANTLYYPGGGGHRWVYLNWALGLRALGCQVIWLEGVDPATPPRERHSYVGILKRHLQAYGLDDAVALCFWGGEPVPDDDAAPCVGMDAAAGADLLLNLRYDLDAKIVKRFRRSALLDIDPGLLQLWMSQGLIRVAPHDLYFTTSEAVGRPGGRVPDAGRPWHHTPPCVALDWWPPCTTDDDAPFTTVSHWGTSDEWIEDGGAVYSNDKQCGFEPFLDLPRRTTQPLELALCLAPNQAEERRALNARGWRVRLAQTVAATPQDYQSYVQHSRGEFSCVKPSCVRLENAWISDRTLCYLASGKPAVVQHTGASRLLPDAAGLFRFRTLEEAARALETAAADYERHSTLARALAEEHFDARIVVARVLDQALA